MSVVIIIEKHHIHKAAQMAEMNRSFQGVWIPSELWLDRSLSITEKVMIVEIRSLESSERGCYASNAHFGEFFDLSNSRVSEIISGLEKKGIITTEYLRAGKLVAERQIRISKTFGKPNEVLRKTEEGYSEKAKVSNTTNNNTYKTSLSETPSERPDQQVKKKYSFTEEDMRCAQYIANKVDALAGYPGKHPMDNWANTIRLMRERDNRNHREICDLFKWANNDHFWKDNILSPEKLRKQWQKLTIRRNSERTGTTAARPALDWNNTNWADGLLDSGD